MTLAGLEAHRTGEVLVPLIIGLSDLKVARCRFGKKLKLQNVDVYKNNEVISQKNHVFHKRIIKQFSEEKKGLQYTVCSYKGGRVRQI